LKLNRAKRDVISGYLFLSPALILFVLFFLLPIAAIIYLSFTQYNIINPPKLIGIGNYTKFFHDPSIGNVFKNTIKFVGILVPLHVVGGLLLALGVNREMPAAMKYLYRTVIYFPYLVTTAAVAVAWMYILDENFGVLNYFLGKLQIDRISWLNSSFWVFVAVAIFSLWKFVGQPFVYYLIGLQNVPKDLVEAAEIDGANRVQTFFHITLPMLSPTVFFVVLTTMIGAIQIFDEPYIITKGGPGDASRTINLYIYQLAYTYNDLGYASTVAFSLFILILTITLLVYFLGNKFVNYDQH
jgi:multiple sugar transport system permease protein